MIFWNVFNFAVAAFSIILVVSKVVEKVLEALKVESCHGNLDRVAKSRDYFHYTKLNVYCRGVCSINIVLNF